MSHFASPRFWEAYRQLPVEMQRQADQSFELLKRNPRHPSLHFKQIGRFWTARVGRGYRAVAVVAEDGLHWFWIGPHDEYDALLIKLARR